MNKHKGLAKNFDELVSRAYPADEPGTAVLIAKNGEVIYCKGQGMANLEWQIPIEPEMVFRWASITKQFTAVAILILLEQGKLKLDESITTYLPDYPLADQPFTIRHLLTHTSGIVSYTDMPEWMSLWRKDFTVPELIDLFKDKPKVFAPGEKYAYNNSGYILLGAIIEALSGQTYVEFINTHIFEPAGMKTAVYDQPQKIIPQRVSGYSQSPDGFINAHFVSMTQPYAAGALAGSVYDLFAWDQALYGEKLLKQSTLALAFEPFTLNDGSLSHYGFGWGLVDYRGHRLLSHSGGIHGFTTLAIRERSSKTYVAVLTNLDARSPDLLAYQLMGEAFGKPLRVPEGIPLSKKVLEKRVGQFKINEATSRKIFIDGDKLYSQLGERPPVELVPVTEDRFVMANIPLWSLLFVRDEKRSNHSG